MRPSRTFTRSADAVSADGSWERFCGPDEEDRDHGVCYY